MHALLMFIVAAIIVLFLAGIRIVRPTHRGLVERLGKYHRFADPGFSWVIPVIDKMFQINITEQMVNAELVNIIGDIAGTPAILPLKEKFGQR